MVDLQNVEETLSIKHGMSYRGFETFTDHIHDHSEYRMDGSRFTQKFGTMNKLRLFIKSMSTRMKESTFELYAEALLALKREQFNNVRQEDMIRMTSGPTSSPPGPTTPMTTSTGHTKGTTASESQVVLNNFKKGTKRGSSAFPIFKNDHYYDTFQRSFLAIIKAQGLYDVADPDFDPDDGDQYDKELFQGKKSFVYSVLVTSLQTYKGTELVKEFERDTRTIISKLHHYHPESNIAQHEIVTLTTYITNLIPADHWKGTTHPFLSHFK